MRCTAACYDDLRATLDTVPLVDCHDHSGSLTPKLEDPVDVIIGGYFVSDCVSAVGEKDVNFARDHETSLEERWPVLDRIWKRTCHTGYARVTRLVMKEFYGENDVTLDALHRMAEKLMDMSDPALYESLLDKANIAARLENTFRTPADVGRFLSGEVSVTPRGVMVIPLPDFHRPKCYADVQQIGGIVGRAITSLDEYLGVCREVFEKLKDAGAVAFKDQSAYQRRIDYGPTTRAEAEAVFNRFMADPRIVESYPDGIAPLDNFLFHEFMRMARDMDLPVQIHTGHMAGIRNDIAKTNAVHLTPVLELHRETRFDLFHANWPYDGEIIFLGKNYPNVAIDFCWANIIDPIYCQRMFQQALSAVPHAKVHGYGSDYAGSPDRAWAHATIARDNIAIALSQLVEMDYLDLDDAKQVGRAWLFGNANEFFRLDLQGA